MRSNLIINNINASIIAIDKKLFWINLEYYDLHHNLLHAKKKMVTIEKKYIIRVLLFCVVYIKSYCF